jgi:hypothetical protein
MTNLVEFNQEPTGQIQDHRLESALNSSALIEMYYDCIERLSTSIKDVKVAKQPIVENIIEDLRAIGTVLDDCKTTIPILKEQFSLNTRVKNYSSQIQELGLEGQILHKYLSLKQSSTEIAEYFNLSAQTVGRFIRYYESCKPTEQLSLRKKSVFDVTDQLEDLAVIIERQMINLEGENDEIHVQYVREMRMTLELAMKVIDRINNYQTLQKVVSSVGEAVIKYVPQHLRAELFKELNEIVPGSL